MVWYKIIKSESKQISLLKRVLSSLVLIPVVFFVIYKGYPLFEIGLLFVGILLAWEWANMVPSKNSMFYFGAYVFALAAAIGYYSYWMLGVIALTTLLVWYKSKGEKRRGLLTLGAAYISIGIGSLIWVSEYMGVVSFVWLLLVVWGMDTGGFFVGSIVKGPKLCPKISPNKTYSGLLGGVVFAVIFSGILIWYLESVSREALLTMVEYETYLSELKSVYLYASLWAVFFAIISQIGDLIESSIKRSLKIKDTSNLIPGHGGVFDRIDALIFTAPVMFVCFKLFYLYGVIFS